MRQYVRQMIEQFVVDEGQGLAEYAMILGLVAVICVVALTGLGGAINALVYGPIVAVFGAL